MNDLSEFSAPVRLMLRAYRWRRIDPVPFNVPAKPLAESRMALVSSAGFVLPDQTPFDRTRLAGDSGFREIPADTNVMSLRDCHRSESFDHAGMIADPNLVFPLDRVRELAERGRIGSVNARHLSFMGSIPAPGRLIRESAPAAASLLKNDGVDIALLVPV